MRDYIRDGLFNRLKDSIETFTEQDDGIVLLASGPPSQPPGIK